MPPPDILKKVRQEIDYNPDGLIKFMKSSDFKKYFGTFEGDRLKKAPKGYSPDHPNIELLRLKSYIVFHPIEDAELLKPDFLENATRIFKAMLPLNNYIRTALHE